VVELLESRVVLYSATGNAWMNPEVITISFVPDGTNLGGVTSNLQGKFNSNANLAGKWENVILQSAQTWAQKTNINFVVVPDNGAASGSGPDQEGNPGFGDIRIGGYNFGNSTLAWSYYPPSANNYSIAGDINFNTAMTYNIGSTYDLFTVAAHEFGHALGLGESSTSSADIMYPTYTGQKTALVADDIAGIQSIYSANLPRTPDVYAGLNSSFVTAANLDSKINLSTLTALAYNLDVATAGQTEFFSVDAPAGTSGAFEVTAQSLGLSLLAPKMTVYAANMATVLGSANGAGQYGTNLTVTVPNATAGERFYVEVQGADNTAFGTGDYALGMSFNGTAPPTEASPVIAYPNGTPLKSGGGTPDQVAPGADVLVGAAPTITGISTDTGASPSDGITNVNRILILGIAANNETINVYINGTLLGTTTTNNQGNWTFDNTGTALADGNYTLTATAIDPDGDVSAPSYPYGATIDTSPPPAPTISGIVDGTVLGSTGTTTTDSNPVIFGTAQPYTQVALYQGSTLLGTVAADNLGNWDWSVNGGLSIGVQYSFTAQATDIAGNTSSRSATTNVILVTPTTGAQAATVSSASLSVGSFVSVNADGSFNVITASTTSGAATPAPPAPPTPGPAPPTPGPAPPTPGPAPPAPGPAPPAPGPAPPAPAPPGPQPPGAQANAIATPTISGLATPNSEVVVFDDGVIIATALVDPKGNWSFTIPTLSTGQQQLTFEAVNQNGTFSAVAYPITIRV